MKLTQMQSDEKVDIKRKHEFTKHASPALRLWRNYEVLRIKWTLATGQLLDGTCTFHVFMKEEEIRRNLSVDEN